jgi:hypothetical protein
MLASPKPATTKAEAMDLKLVREQAIEATTRAFWDKSGFVPDQDSEEWEAEYRRQFERAKARHANGEVAPAAPRVAAMAAATPAIDPAKLAPLTGEPTQIRWAATLRDDRLREVRDPGVRDWLASTWTRAKSWIDTRELATPVFLQRIAPHYRQYREEVEEQARLRAREREARDAAAAAIRKQVEEAGITVAGLIELIDVCDRLAAVPLKTKLAELDYDGRNLRIFETDDPALLMVLDKDKTGRSDYAIERDEGLMADLTLFMRAAAYS